MTPLGAGAGGRLSLRQDLRALDPQASLIPLPTQNGLRTPGADPPPGVSVGLRPVRHGQEPFRRGARARRSTRGCGCPCFSLERLAATVAPLQGRRSTSGVIKRICQADMTGVDDVGMPPAGQAEGEALYRLVDAAYEKRSLAVTSTSTHPASAPSCLRP